MSTPSHRANSSKNARLVLLLLMSVVVCACNTKPVARDVPASVAPLGENIAPGLRSDGDGLDTSLQQISGERGGTAFAHARGVIEAPLEQVMAAIQADNVVNHRRVDRSESIDLDLPAVDRAFELRNTVDAIITVRYSLIWKVKQASGVGYARWDLASAPSFIKANRGSVVVRMLDENTTEVELMHELNAPRTSPGDLEVTLRDLFESLRRGSTEQVESAG